MSRAKDDLRAARHFALRVLASKGVARLSNRTNPRGSVDCVHWRTALWLINEGYARRGFVGDTEIVRLTDAGASAARDLGFEVAS